MPESYHKGQKIHCRGEEWQILQAREHKQVNGTPVWEIEAQALSGLVKGERYIFLNDLDQIDLIDPIDIKPVMDGSRNARRTRTFLEAHLRRLLPRNGAIYLGEHGAFQKMDFQMKPAAKALNMLRPRILIGDAVGLGKTIECGILLSELIRRGKARRVLCAVPKAILEQFQMEMWGRFAIPFHRLDSKGLERLRQDLPSTMNPFFHFEKAIISVDTLKLKKYQKLLEDCQWDVLVIDECHNVADRTDGMGGSARHRVAKRLSQNSNAVVLMSATPHDGTKYGFASLVKLLDRTLIPSDEAYSADDISGVFIRRTRTTVENEIEARAPRVEQLEKVPLNPKEVDLLQLLHDIDFRSSTLAGAGRRGVKELFKTTLIKSFLSSPAALEATVSKKRDSLLKKLESGPAGKDTEDAKGVQVLDDVLFAIKGLKGKFSRLDHLTKFIESQAATNDSKLVIFTERIRTMEFVAQYLIDKGFSDARFDPKAAKQAKGTLLATAQGGNTDVDLNTVVRKFQSNKSNVNILVTTNVASEGLNLHDNCHRLIHFDLPWSLITLEQRNGRIDRLGQTQQPHIYYFASTAGEKTRESDPKKLKDDFWIVDKVQVRMDQAAEDMDEDARRRFTTGEDEELQNTENYQAGETETTLDEKPNSLMALFEQRSLANQNNDGAVKFKTLPTLFESSPGDFVETLVKEAGIEINSQKQTELSLHLDSKLQYEVKEHWPREFRPTDKTIAFEMSKDRMEAHYKARLNSQEALDKTFMNEIHPAINLLEHTALGLFPGQEVPVLKFGGPPGSLFFLLQGTLYNKVNEAVFQSWQLVEFEKGSSECKKFDDLSEPEHTNAVARDVREFLDHEIPYNEISKFEHARIKALSKPALDWMTGLIAEARTKRAAEKKPGLLAELKRISQWETNRKAFLNDVIKTDGKVIHGGTLAMASNAKDELGSLDRETNEFKDYLKNCIYTNDSPDVRILAIFIGAES